MFAMAQDVDVVYQFMAVSMEDEEYVLFPHVRYLLIGL